MQGSPAKDVLVMRAHNSSVCEIHTYPTYFLAGGAYIIAIVVELKGIYKGRIFRGFELNPFFKPDLVARVRFRIELAAQRTMYRDIHS